MKKKFILTLIFAIALLCTLSLGAAAKDTIHSGTWGDLTWELNETTGELVISGEGSMSDFSSSYSTNAWRAYKTSIKSVTIAEGVTSIVNYAFYDCSKLTSITIPASVTSIGVGYSGVFYGCAALTSITVDAANTTYATIGGVLYDKAITTLICYPTGKNDASITIPTSVTSIGSAAFADCTALTSITIPASVTSIGERAFMSCDKLVEVYDLSTVLTITKGSSSNGYVGRYAKDVYTTAGAQSKLFTDANGYQFYDNRYLMGYHGAATALTLPADCNGNSYGIYQYAFRYNDKITSITIPASVTSIGYEAFYYCTALTEINFNATAMYAPGFGDNIFYNAGEDGDGSTVHIGANVTRIPEYLFYGAEITAVTFAEGSQCTSIGSYAFEYCRALTSITIPVSVTSIGNGAFEDCTALTSITIPASVTSIGNYAFKDCSALESVTFAEDSQCTSIGYDAFYNCTALESIIIPASVTSIGSDAFYNCTTLACVAITGTPSVYSNAFDGCPNAVFFLKTTSVPNSWTYGNPVILGCNFSTASPINEFDADFLTFHTTENLVFTGSTVQPRFFLTYKNLPLDPETDFVVYIHNNLDATANATLSVCGVGAYTGLLKTFDFVIEAADISGCTVTTTDVTFWGSPCIPNVIVKNGDLTLAEGIDYSVIVYNNTQPGTGLVKIIGIGNYRGCIDTTFSILPIAEENIFTDNKIQIPSAQDLYRIPLNTSLTLESLTTIERDSGSLAPTIEYSWSFSTPLDQTSSRSSKSTSYRFTSLGIYTVTLAVTITTYTYEYQYHGAAAVLTKVPHPSTTTTTLSIQVVTEPISPQQLIADPPVPFGLENAFLSVSTETLYATIGEIQWSSSDSTVISVAQNGMITYHKPGTATITATTEFGTVSWEIENMALNLSLYGKIISYDPQTESINVYFGNTLLTKDKDFTLAVNTYDSNISRLTITGKDLFAGSISILYSHETNRFYSCEHTCQTWSSVDAEIHSGACSTCHEPMTAIHSWNSGVVTTPATHTALGTMTYTCTDCGETRTEDIAKLTAHEWGDWQKHDATQHKHICTCTDVAYEDHNWNSGVVTTPATHTTLGTMTYTCTDCGETKTEDIAKLTAHEWGDWQKHNADQHKRVCACEDIDYDAHNWNSSEITTPSTHTTIGVKTYTCADCGETKTEDVAKLTAHEYGDWVTVEEAEIGKAGKKEKTCACGATVEETIPALQESSAGELNNGNATKNPPGVGVIVGIGGGSAALLGGVFCLYWFVLRKKKFF